ncbi:MAG: hypothetical protein KA072_11935 [Thermoanaerobaculaceae bacterium]|nr:hypothetical protein [Thermoanaerobaculaceae bacterium]NLH11710.1 hypothetical protein [Holophagae bacterium]HPW55967.1 hypothetical protein [Thermoanaerobaculaceae bacterium]
MLPGQLAASAGGELLPECVRLSGGGRKGSAALRKPPGSTISTSGFSMLARGACGDPKRAKPVRGRVSGGAVAASGSSITVTRRVLVRPSMTLFRSSRVIDVPCLMSMVREVSSTASNAFC